MNNRAGQMPGYLSVFDETLDTLIHARSSSLFSDADSLATLHAAVSYSLANGGKRIRPMLCFAASEAIVTGVSDATSHAACALEIVHAYSLVHDDLPAMDDDDLRRGKPSLHKAYDDATAILVGDGLQALAFEILASAPGLSAEQKLRMVGALARAIGPQGMVGGQYMDIQAVETELGLRELQLMHSLKTGALIRAAVALGGIAASGSNAQLAALDEFGGHIGLAFQVVDDILDVEGDTATLGKTSGKDCEANKPTYVKLLGLDGAKEEAKKLLESALSCLDGFDQSADKLRQLARLIVERDR